MVCRRENVRRHLDRGSGNSPDGTEGNIVPGKTIWALGLQRTVPGVGLDSWTTPAGPRWCRRDLGGWGLSDVLPPPIFYSANFGATLQFF